MKFKEVLKESNFEITINKNDIGIFFDFFEVMNIDYDNNVKYKNKNDVILNISTNNIKNIKDEFSNNIVNIKKK